DHAEFCQHATGKTADAELQSLKIVDFLDLLAKPAAHLRSGVAGRKRENVVLLVELVHQVDAAAKIHPCVLHAAVESKRHGATERKGRILADVVVGSSVAHLDRAIRHRVG